MLPKDLPMNGASQAMPPHRFNARIIIFFFLATFLSKDSNKNHLKSKQYHLNCQTGIL